MQKYKILIFLLSLNIFFTKYSIAEARIINDYIVKAKYGSFVFKQIKFESILNNWVLHSYILNITECDFNNATFEFTFYNNNKSVADKAKLFISNINNEKTVEWEGIIHVNTDNIYTFDIRFVEGNYICEREKLENPRQHEKLLKEKKERIFNLDDKELIEGATKHVFSLKGIEVKVFAAPHRTTIEAINLPKRLNANDVIYLWPTIASVGIGIHKHSNLDGDYEIKFITHYFCINTTVHKSRQYEEDLLKAGENNRVHFKKYFTLSEE